MRRRRYKIRSQKKYYFLLLSLFLVYVLIIGLLACLVYRFYSSRVYLSCSIEAGNVEITPEDFLKKASKKIKYSWGFDPSSIQTNKAGTYPVELSSGLFRYHASLTVVDTVPPQGEVRELTVEYGARPMPEEFLVSVSDVEEVKVYFVDKPNYAKTGRQDVTLFLEDAAGNLTLLKTKLTIIPFRVSVEIEAGSKLPTLKDFLMDGEEAGSNVLFVTDLSSIDVNSVGTYPVVIQKDAVRYESKLIVKDTTPPEVTVRDVAGYTGYEVAPENFVSSAKDVTSLTVEYDGAVDFSKAGTQSVSILVRDEGGNAVKKEAKLTLKQDLEAPVIKGAQDQVIAQNATINYKNGIKVTDNCDENVTLSVTGDVVNTKVPGKYSVTYVATDKAGNSSSVTVTFSVVKGEYDIETVYALADEVIAQIITPDMSSYDKLSAIFWWVRKNVTYVEADNKNDWCKAAYSGLKNHKGDCYVYCMTSRALLDRAGIKNMVIDTIPLRDVHYWNLVDIGEGWRHFDTTPRRAGGDFLYWDDARITEYSNAHNNSHIYDRERFPDVK